MRIGACRGGGAMYGSMWCAAWEAVYATLTLSRQGTCSSPATHPSPRVAAGTRAPGSSTQSKAHTGSPCFHTKRGHPPKDSGCSPTKSLHPWSDSAHKAAKKPSPPTRKQRLLANEAAAVLYGATQLTRQQETQPTHPPENSGCSAVSGMSINFSLG